MGWPWSSGNRGAGLRDGTVFPHCSALPGVNPGLVSLVDIGCRQGKRGPLAGFGLPGRFPKRNRGGCCWQTLPKTAGWDLSVPKAQRSARDPHFGILPVTRRRCWPVPATLSQAAHAANPPEHRCEKRHGEKTPPFEVKTGKERFLDSGWVKLGGVCYSGVITTVNEDREILESWNGSGRKGPLKVILNRVNRQKSTQINPLGVDANPLQAS